MLIAISQRNDKNKFGDFFDNLENDYIDYLEKFGFKLIIIPNYSKKIFYYFEKLPIKGIILSGGNDINPELYGEKIKEGLTVSKARDKTEGELLEIAIKKKLPVLGICRGMQFINVFFKGKIVKNVKGHVKANHKVEVIDMGLTNLIGKGEIEVNSYHNQGVSKEFLSSELKVCAISEDGFIEGLYHPKYSIAGIQWHPEREGSDKEADRKIIKAFLNKKLFWNL